MLRRNNIGTNFIQGQISYQTLALTAVLKLAVTMDYSIFLWHSYQEQIDRYDGDKKRAMAHAISHTIVSVTGSSITTIAGFVALCFMSFTLGLDLGIVMAKGVVSVYCRDEHYDENHCKYLIMICYPTCNPGNIRHENLMLCLLDCLITCNIRIHS